METPESNEAVLGRDKKIISFFKSHAVFLIILMLLVILGIYIRTLPMTDHGGRPGLWDITTNTWTLGPDLDPFLFVRYAKMIDVQGSIPEIDTMRYAPVGFITAAETQLLPWLIYLNYRFINAVSSSYYPMEFSGVIFPVIMFALTIISFFFFVREVFYEKKKKNHFYAGLIASISTLFLIIAPSFLARTIAGIPEKESAGFFFMFLTFFLFIKAWKEETVWKSIIYGIFAGIATALMGLIWGGVTYIYSSIAVASIIGFILNKFKKKDYFAYAAWFISSAMVLAILLPKRFSMLGFATSLDSGMAFFLLVVLCFHFAMIKFNIYLKLKTKYSKLTLPDTLLSIIGTLIVLLIGASIIIDPTFLWDKIMDLNRIFFNPTAGGRWVTTVAENQQPYFVQWAGNFGTYFLWSFLFGSMVFVNELFKKLKGKDRNLVVGGYIIFLLGLMYSRYAPAPYVLNGENFISKAFYLLSAGLFAGILIYTYIKYHKEESNVFDNISYASIFILVLFILTLFTARSAVRLVMVLATVAPIFAAYLIAQLIEYFRENNDSTRKLVIGIVLAVVIMSSMYSAYTYYNTTKNQAYNYVPYYYTFQWQQAMSWIQTTTPTDAVFVSWWDYGYWIQSMGERATVTDGGNSNVWWNYLIGRYVLTGDNQQDLLDFTNDHGVSYLLIDSSDMGKYGAYSQIGSDIDYDRLSNGPTTMVTDPKTVVETKNSIIKTYQGQGYMEEDILLNGTMLFKENSAIIGIQISQTNGSYDQPQGIFYSAGRQLYLPLRYLYVNGEFYDFGSGLEGAASIIQRVYQGNGGLQLDPEGALIYVSPRVMRGFFGQVYILDDPFNNFPALEVIHTQPDFILQQFTSQGLVLNDFVEYQGIRGPIKIWEITYTGNEKPMKDSLAATVPDYINWSF